MFIPAICDKPSCRTVWLTDRLVGGAANATVHFERCQAGPCPRCGGFGRIPDGIYTPAGGQLFDGRDLSLVLAALQALQRRAAQGATRTDLSKEIESKYPFLKPLRRYLPSNSAELVAWLSLAVATATYIQGQRQAPGPVSVTNIYVQQEITQVLERATRPPPERKSPEENGRRPK